MTVSDTAWSAPQCGRRQAFPCSSPSASQPRQSIKCPAPPHIVSGPVEQVHARLGGGGAALRDEVVHVHVHLPCEWEETQVSVDVNACETSAGRHQPPGWN